MAVATKKTKTEKKLSKAEQRKVDAIEGILEGDFTDEEVLELVEMEILTLDEALAATTQVVKDNADKVKEWTGKKEDDREIFFTLATAYVKENSVLERKSVIITGDESVIPFEVARKYPTFRIVEHEVEEGELEPQYALVEGTEDQWDVLIEEDPALAKFSFKNEELGFEFSRGRTMKGSGFDITSFMADHRGEEDGPEYQPVVYAIVEQSISLSSTMALKGKLTEAVLGSTLAELIEEEDMVNVSYVLNDKKVEQYIADHPEFIEVFQKYQIEGVPSMSLLAPKKLSKAKKGKK